MRSQRKRGKAALAAPSPREPSPWQEPPAFFTTVLERLLAMPDGTKHVRLASHVCHHWRVTAQEVLLADTAISRPPMEDFRAIGHQQPLQPVKQQQRQETVTTRAGVVMEASASTGMEAISKQRFDGPAGALAAGMGAVGRSRGRAGWPLQPEAPPRVANGAQAFASHPEAAVLRQLREQRQTSMHRLHQLVAATQLELDGARHAQQALQAQQQGSVGPGSTTPAAAGHGAGASPSSQLPAGGADAPQGSIQSGMAVIGRRRTAPIESESEGGSTRATGPTKRRRARRSSEPSAGRGTSVEQPLRQQEQLQQAQQQAAGPAQRTASGQHASLPARAAQGAAAEAGTSRRRRRSVSMADTEVAGRPSKRQQTSAPRRANRAGLRSSGPVSGDGLPDTQHQRPHQQQRQQQAQQAVGREHEAQQAQQQQVEASGRQRRRPSQMRSEQDGAAQQEQQQAGDATRLVQVEAGKPADPAAASGSHSEAAEDGADAEQQLLQQGSAAGEGGAPWQQTAAAEGGLQAAFNVVWRFLRLRP